MEVTFIADMVRNVGGWTEMGWRLVMPVFIASSLILMARNCANRED